MGYVAAKGGTQAVLNAEELLDYFRLRGESDPITVRQIQDQMRLAVDRAMGEGALYAPELAALALKQSEGDSLEASFLLRAYRSTVPRLAYSLPAEGERMRVLRRISATFKDIPGGQMLGPTRDYQLKLLNTLLANETSESMHAYLDQFEKKIDARPLDGQTGIFPKVIENMREQGILAEPPADENVVTPLAGVRSEAEPYDVTRKAISFPAPRSARLQMLAQGDVGSLQTFAYSSVRGYGDVHPTLGELRLGYLPVEVAHPLTGEPVAIGEILATECEMVSRVYATHEQHGAENSLPKFGLGYGFSFGHNEVKVMSMSIIDRVISAAKESGVHGQGGPAADEEFVLLHIDGIESSGFTAHYKLPHYVSFQSDISVLERARDYRASLATTRSEAAEMRQKDQ